MHKRIIIVSIIVVVLVLIIAISALVFMYRLSKTEIAMEGKEKCNLTGVKVLIVLFENYQVKEFKPTYDTLKQCNASISILAANKTIDITYNYYIMNVNFTALAEDYDMLIIIGGPGVYMRVTGQVNDPAIDLVGNLAEQFLVKDKYVAAICAAPAILAKADLLRNVKATCYPATELIQILKDHNAIYVDKPVVIDDHVITSQSPETVNDFISTIIQVLQQLKT